MFLGSDGSASDRIAMFDFVFVVWLRYVDKVSSLPELIVAQHDKLDSDDINHLNYLVKGRTKHKVLLLMDGYDEYKPGANKEVDKAIDSTTGNCFLILTSRPGYLNKQSRNKMDGEIIIEGFSKINIRRYTELNLGGKEKCDILLEQAKETGIDNLLHVPVILLMVCAIFIESKELPKTKTDIVRKIFRLAMDRSTLKTFDAKSDGVKQLDEILCTLGKFSWEALQDDVQQLLLDKVKLCCSNKPSYKFYPKNDIYSFALFTCDLVIHLCLKKYYIFRRD